MSDSRSLHYQLCLEGARWLRRRKSGCRECTARENCKEPYYVCAKFKYVAVELCVNGAENADVWAFDGFCTVVIEVKTSHADFLNDKKKFWRGCDDEFQAGNLRWFLCPEGVIRPDELPDGWGLLYWNGKKVYPVTPPVRRMQGCHGDIRILYSLLRREKFPEKIFNYRGYPTTIHSKV